MFCGIFGGLWPYSACSWQVGQLGYEGTSDGKKQNRNRHIELFALGRTVISVYEWASPPLVDLARRSETFRGMIRGVLGPAAFVVTHLRVSAAADLKIVAGGAIGFLWHMGKKKARRQSEGSSGESF
jgi:hypothetical protein